MCVLLAWMGPNMCWGEANHTCLSPGRAGSRIVSLCAKNFPLFGSVLTFVGGSVHVYVVIAASEPTLHNEPETAPVDITTSNQQPVLELLQSSFGSVLLISFRAAHNSISVHVCDSRTGTQSLV